MHVNGSVASDVIIDCNIHNLFYGNFRAVRDSQLPIKKGKITAFIGPSGCGLGTTLESRLPTLAYSSPAKILPWWFAKTAAARLLPLPTTSVLLAIDGATAGQGSAR